MMNEPSEIFLDLLKLHINGADFTTANMFFGAASSLQRRLDTWMLLQQNWFSLKTHSLFDTKKCLRDSSPKWRRIWRRKRSQSIPNPRERILSPKKRERGCRGEQEWLLGVREQEREWISPFPKFGNRKGMKKLIPKFGNRKGLKNFHPKIREWWGNEKIYS